MSELFFLAKKILVSLMAPPMGPLLLALLGLCLLRRWPRGGRFLAWMALLGMVVLSLPVVGTHLLASLETEPPVSREKMVQAQAIIILGGGTYYGAPEYGGDTVSKAALERLRYGARLHRESTLPLLVTGGTPFGGQPEAESMRQALEKDFQVPVRWIEPTSRDTAENASLSAALLLPAGIQRVMLVSHAWHLPRATAQFAKAGFTVIPAPMGYSTASHSDLENWLPSTLGLERSARAMIEYLGLFLARAKAGV